MQLNPSGGKSLLSKHGGTQMADFEHDFDLAVQAQKRYEDDKAAELFQALLERDLSDQQRVQVCIKFAEVYVLSPKTRERSYELFNSALELDPDNAVVHEKLGWAYQLDGRWEECAAHFIKAYSLAKNFDFLLPIGFSLTAVHKFEDALHYLNIALEEREWDAGIHGALGYLYLVTNQAEKAVHYYETAVELDPEDSNFKFNLSIARMHAH